MSDNNGRILVLQAQIYDEIFLLISLYNTEPEQIETLSELETILLNFDANEYNHITFPSDFRIFFSASLEATDGNAKLKIRTAV